MAAPASLHEGSLRLEDLQSRLETLYLSFTPSLPLFIALRLGNTAIFQLCIVFENSRELRVCGVPVSREVADTFIQTLKLLCLVDDVLRLHGLRHLVVLSGLLIHSNGISFLRLLGRQVLGKI